MKTLQQIDAEIVQLEQQLAVLHEQRREWVNHLDLNKKLIRAQDFKVTADVSPYKFVNVTLPGITVLHVPTGYAHHCDSHRSQHRNKTECIDTVTARLAAEGWVYAS